MHTEPIPCHTCKGMGSVKARVRLEAGHRCVRCHHPFMTKGDAKMLGVEPSGGHWSPCDARCTHEGPVRALADPEIGWETFLGSYNVSGVISAGVPVEAEWRVLTVHHLDGDKANLRWWNLVSLCQRCHLEIQGKIVMERVYPHEHSEWFRPYVSGYYAFVYLCRVCGRNMDRPAAYVAGGPSPSAIALDRLHAQDYPHMCEPGLEITREEAIEHMDFLLGLELAAV